MRVNMNDLQNFTGFIRYGNREQKKISTIDTQNIVAIQQRDDFTYAKSDCPTDIIVKNTFENQEKAKYIIYRFDMPIDKVIGEYNKACQNKSAELDCVENISYSA